MHSSCSFPRKSFSTPSGDHEPARAGFHALSEDLIVAGTDGVGVDAEFFRVGGAERKEVDDAEPVETETLRVANAFPDGGVVTEPVGDGWVEHDEVKDVRRGLVVAPVAVESVSVIAVDVGGAPHSGTSCSDGMFSTAIVTSVPMPPDFGDSRSVGLLRLINLPDVDGSIALLGWVFMPGLCGWC